MVRLIIMLVAGILFLGLGVRSLTIPGINYLLIAGYFLTGTGLLFYAWSIRKTGKGNIAAAVIFIVGFILTMTGNFM